MDLAILIVGALWHVLAWGCVLYLVIRIDRACDRIKGLHKLYANKTPKPLHINAMSKENEGN